MRAPSAPDAPLLTLAYDYGRFMALFSALDPSGGVTAGTIFQSLRWFISIDVGASASGIYFRTTIDTTKP
jgi:hypothetical protein